MKYLLAALLLTGSAYATEPVTPNILIITHEAGFCSALAELNMFSDSVASEASDEFLVSFVNHEADIMNESVDELLLNCEASEQVYNESLSILNNNNSAI